MTEQLTEFAKAKEEGRIIILPCKVGDTAWFVYKNKIEEYTINEIWVDKNGLSIGGTSDVPHGIIACPQHEIGKSVFFAKEEAEASLREVQP